MMAFRSKRGPGSGGGNPAAEHLVHFYDESEAMLQSAAAFLAGGLLRGAPALVVATAEHAGGLRERLEEMGVDVRRAETARQLVLLDAEATLAELLVDGMPDEPRFRAVIGTRVASIAEIWRPFRPLAFGDMVDVLTARGNLTAAVELERLWDDLAQRHGFALYCAYDANRFGRASDRAAFDAICRHHDTIVPVQPLNAPVLEQQQAVPPLAKPPELPAS